MAKSISPLDRHFSLPSIRTVEASRPFAWLRAGWSDMRGNLGASLMYGLVLSFVGYVILSKAADIPYLFTAAISGFFLIGPVAASGLYEISRRHEKGEKSSFAQSLAGLRDERESLLFFGALLAFVLLSWERLSAILFALFFKGNVPDINHFAKDVLLSGEHLQFVAAYLLAGGVLAATVFALSAVAIPMILDRKVDVVTAMMTSFRATEKNIGTMFIWAMLIVACIAIGFATMMIGMVVVLPLLGHATWHAYKDLVE
jgi:uncharacterized membrane protein